jgi:hypothetical protein
MIIVLYSYIIPVFATTIKRNQPETVEETYTLLWTVSTLKNTSPDKLAKIISTVRDSDGKLSINTAYIFPK